MSPHCPLPARPRRSAASWPTPRLRRALATPPADPVATALLRVRYASLLGDAGRPAHGLAEIAPAQQVLEKLVGADDVRFARAVEAAGVLQFLAGNLQAAATELRRADVVYRARLARDDVAIVRVLNRRAIVQRELGEYASAEQLLAEAEALLAARPDDPERADNRAQIHNTRGGLYYYESDLRNAVRNRCGARGIRAALRRRRPQAEPRSTTTSGSCILSSVHSMRRSTGCSAPSR